MGSQATELTRSEVLSAIDYEISSIEKEQASPGWTKWTFYGVFGTLVWLAIGEASHTFSVAHAALMMVSCSLVADLVQDLSTPLKAGSNSALPVKRIQIASQLLGGYRLGLVGFAFRTAFIFWAYLTLLNTTSLQFKSRGLEYYCGLMLLLSFAGLMMSFCRMPLYQAAFKQYKWHGLADASWFCVMTGPLAFAVYDVLQLCAAEIGRMNAAEIKIGLISAVFLWLLQAFLIHSAGQHPLLNTLKQVRRDLAFNRITPTVALDQANVALAGLTFESYFEPELRDILQHVDTCSKAMHTLEIRIKEASALISAARKSASDAATVDSEKLKMVPALLESRHFHRQNINNYLDSAKASLDRYARKKAFLKLAAGDDLSSIHEKVSSMISQLVSQAETIDRNEAALRTEACEIFKLFPSVVDASELKRISDSAKLLTGQP